MKIVLIAFALGAIFAPDLLAYVNMSKVTQRANSLHMNVQDYEFAMAIAGTLSGTLLGLFIWKVK